MSDRVSSLTVVLKKDYKDEDCEKIKDAIRMIKGVISVKMNIYDVTLHTAKQQLKYEMQEKLWKVVNE
jgi:cell division protein FtsX